MKVVYRYGIKVLNDAGVINKLIRGVRFNFLKLEDILSVAHSEVKMFAKSLDFQMKLTNEINRRMMLQIAFSSKIESEKPRITYIGKEFNKDEIKVSEAITNWLLETKSNGKQERMIRKLNYELEKQFQENKKAKRKYENDINDLMNHKRRFISETNLPRRDYDNNKKEERKYSAIEMLGIRKTEKEPVIARERGKTSPKSNGSQFSFTEKNPIDDDYRQRKIREREEELKRQKDYEEFKKKHEIENTKNLNLESLKRREDQNRRKEIGGNYGDRYSKIEVRTPMDKNQGRSSVTYTRNARRSKNGVWNKLPDFCTIF